MSQLLQNAKQQFLDLNGNPLSGGSVTFYQPGTFVPVDTYQDQALTITNANPLTLDANGEAIIWGSDSTAYRQIVKDAVGNTVWDQVTAIVGFSDPMSAQGDLIVGGANGSATRLALGANGQVLMSNGTTLVYGALDAADVGADPAGTAAALKGIGGLATLVLAGYPPNTHVGSITISSSAPSGTPADGQLWFQYS